MRHRTLGHVAWGLVVLLALRAAAQQQEPPRYTGHGKIQELGDGIVSMVDASGQPYLVAFDRRSGYQVQVVGSADETYLAPGMLVRFTADLNEKGVAQEPIKRLSIVELSEVVRPGLQAQLAIGEEPNKRGPQTYVVVGQIRSVRRGQLQVATPDGAVKAKLDPEAEIEIDVSDYRLARKDDKLEVEMGFLLAPPQGEQPGQVVAQRVIIELDPQNPLTGKGKKQRPAKKAKDAADEGSADSADKSEKSGKEPPRRAKRGRKNGGQAEEKQDKQDGERREGETKDADKPEADERAAGKTVEPGADGGKPEKPEAE